MVWNKLQNINPRLVKFVLIFSFIAILIIPRFFLLLTGIDSQRIPDVNTNISFSLIKSVLEHNTLDFFTQAWKYPFLGAFLNLPIIALSYIFSGQSNPNQFMNLYAVGGSTIFLYLRIAFVLMNLISILGLYLTVRKFLNSKSAFYTLLIMISSFILIFFSVQPRIHALEFIGTVVVLFFVFKYLKSNELGDLWLSALMSGIAFSLSQSGSTTIIMPVVALLINNKLFFNNETVKRIFYIIGIFIATSLILGYPNSIISILVGYPVNAFLSPEHSKLGIDVWHGMFTIFHTIITYELPVLFIILSTAFLCIRNRKSFFDKYDIVAISHIIFFIIIFGFTNVMSMRFILVILPSLYFLAGNLARKNDSSLSFRIVFGILLIINFFAVFFLTKAAIGGDTREIASKYIVKNSQKSNIIISSIDNFQLGIIPTPKSIRVNNLLGWQNLRISQMNLINENSRYFVWKYLDSEEIDNRTPKIYASIISTSTKNYPNSGLIKSIRTIVSPQNSSNSLCNYFYLDWNEPTSDCKYYLPLFFYLYNIKRFGPEVIIENKHMPAHDF